MRKLPIHEIRNLMWAEKEYMKDTHWKRFWRLKVFLWLCKMNHLAKKYNLDLYGKVTGRFILPYKKADGEMAAYEFYYKTIASLWSNPEEKIKEIIAKTNAKPTALIAVAIKLPLCICDRQGAIDASFADCVVLRRW